MASSSSGADLKTPRLMRFRLIAEKKFSTAFSQDADVGVKWKTHLGSVVIQNDMDDFACRDLPLHCVEELDELLMAVALHAATDDRAVQNIESGDQRGGSVPLIIVGHGRALAGLQRQAGQVRSSAWIWLFSSMDRTTA